MTPRSLLFSAQEAPIFDKLKRLEQMDPSLGAGIEVLEFGLCANPRDNTAPLISSGFEEVHCIDDGFCIYFTDAVIEQDWAVMGASKQRSLRLRVVVSGRADFSDADHQISSEPECCVFLIEPAGERLTASYKGKTEHKYCQLCVSEHYLQNTLQLQADELPGMLLKNWSDNKSVLGNFAIDRKTYSTALRFFNIDSEGQWRRLEIRAIALELLRQLFKDWMRPQDNTEVLIKLRPEERNTLFKLRDEIDKHPAHQKTIKELSRQTGLNRNKLHYGFKKLFGRSIHEYYTRQRLQLALRLLRETPSAVSEIAYQVGYSEPTNFTSAFKKYFNVLPSQIRKRQTQR